MNRTVGLLDCWSATAGHGCIFLKVESIGCCMLEKWITARVLDMGAFA